MNAGDFLSVISCSRPFDPEDVLCSNAGFEAIEAVTSPLGAQWRPLEFLRFVLESDAVPTPVHACVRDISGMEKWPDADYMQPLR